MCNRPIWKLSFFVLFFGSLLLSLGYNLHLINCVNKLENSLQNNHWITDQEYSEIKKELLRLEKVKYE
jgi:hypothetical protein